MARYVFECEDCYEEHVETFAMGEAPVVVQCRSCAGNATRSFDIQFQQDGRRFRQGISRTTGQAFADSLAAERRIEKEKGIVFVGPSDLSQKEKRLAEYAKHVRAGGERLASDVVNPPEIVKRKTVHDVLRERNIKLSR